jgi:hypothetical protein
VRSHRLRGTLDRALSVESGHRSLERQVAPFSGGFTLLGHVHARAAQTKAQVALVGPSSSRRHDLPRLEAAMAPLPCDHDPPVRLAPSHTNLRFTGRGR